METSVHIAQIVVNTHVERLPAFLTVQQAATECSFSESHMRKLIRDGVLPSYKGDGTSGHVRVKSADVVGMMEARRVIPLSASRR